MRKEKGLVQVRGAGWTDQSASVTAKVFPGLLCGDVLPEATLAVVTEPAPLPTLSLHGKNGGWQRKLVPLFSLLPMELVSGQGVCLPWSLVK